MTVPLHPDLATADRHHRKRARRPIVMLWTFWLQLWDDGEASVGVTGIGGFFFRARDPEAMRAWYVEHLGVGSAPYGSWETRAGPSVFAPFAADTEYFAADRQWMLNLRVDDLDGLCATLRAAGIAVTTDPGWNMPGVGRFARIHDPEGNPVELWQPDSPA